MNMLLTCFANPTPGTPLASQHQTVPNNRAPLLDAANIWEDFFMGRITVRDLLHRNDGSVCLVAPERSEFTPMFITKVQKDLMEMHLATRLGLEHPAWRFGILVNAARFPYVHKELKEDYWLGMHMCHMDFFHVGLWPFIDELNFFSPPKHMQVAIGWRAPRATQVCRYFGVLIFSGSNTRAQELLDYAHKDIHLANGQNVWMEKWGTLRMDLDFLEKRMNSKKPMLAGMLKTWRWMHCPPPKITHWGPPPCPIDISLGFKFSLDFQTPSDPAERWNLEASIKVAVQEVNAQCGNVVNLNTNFRRGYAHQNWDAMDAWDITIDLREVRAACETMHMVVLKLAYFNPLPGYCLSFVCFEDMLAPIFEFSHSNAIVALKQKGYVVWSYFVSTNMAIIDFKRLNDDGDQLGKAVQVC